MRINAILLAGLTLLLGNALPAVANTVTYHVNFEATKISYDFGSGTTTPPVDPVTGSFTITFDPSHDYLNSTTAGITLDSLNLALGSSFGFTYGHTFDALLVGGKEAGISGFNLGASNDFYLLIDGITGPHPFGDYLRYVQTASGDSQFQTSSIKLSFGNPTVTPIPGALPLFVTAIAGIGLAGWAATRDQTRGRPDGSMPAPTG